MMHRGPGLLFCLFAAAATFAHASVALFMEEPYGEFGAVNPTGPRGENWGVISRYHKIDLAPDNRHGGSPKGEWTELVGSSYDRTIHGFQVDSTPAQDQRFITTFNDRRNVRHFNLLFHNCADFSRVVLDIYLPHAIHQNFIADVGLMI